MKHTQKNLTRLERAFSLVEVLAAVAIIGVITFLALPNIITVRQDAEQNLAIARAEAINMAKAAFIQSRGRTSAASAWTGNAQARYTLVSPFLAFAPPAVGDYMPDGYLLDYSPALFPLNKIALSFDPDAAVDDDEIPVPY